jgi:DNA-binding NarL/FixJ family response regulator
MSAEKKERNAAIAEAYRSGEKVFSIALRFGVSDTHISKMARKAGVPPRAAPCHSAEYAETLRLSLDGLTPKEIAERLHLTTNAVRYRIKQAKAMGLDKAVEK